MTGEPAHRPHIRRDRRGVIVWCSCRRWGYCGPCEELASRMYAVHVAEAGRQVAEPPR